MSFDERIHDTSLGFVAEPSDGATAALVAFGGIKGGLGVAPYEFFRVTEGVAARRMFVRDLDQAWYLRGIHGLGTDVTSAARALGDEVARGVPRRVVTVGNSAGGFGAILFGTLMGVDEIHAFSPQTAIDRRHRIAWLDVRWARQMWTVRRTGRLDPGFLDLRVLLERTAGHPPIHVHYCGTHGRDARHAEHLGDLDGVTPHRYPGGGHRLVADLRDRGELTSILAASLE